MTEILTYCAAIFFIIIGWFIVGGVFHIVLYSVNVWDKWKKSIYLPKKKKYLTKVDPIYQLIESDFNDHMYIEKWKLGYEINFWPQLFGIFIPFPIEFYQWRYIQQKGMCIGKREDVLVLSGELKDIYEQLWEKENSKIIKQQKRRNEFDDKVNSFNKVFNENYE